MHHRPARRTFLAIFSFRSAGLGLALSLAALAAPATLQAKSPAAPDLRRVKAVEPRPKAGKTIAVVHYRRPSGDYQGWNLWAWAEGAEGQSFPFRHRDAFGVYAVVELPQRLDRVNFLVRKGDWDAKDVDWDRSVPVGDSGAAEVWLVSEDPQVYEDPKTIDFGVKARAAFLDALDHVSLSLTRPARAASLEPGEAYLAVGERKVAVASAQTVEPSDEGFSNKLRIQLAEALSTEDLAEPLALHVPGLKTVQVVPRDALIDPQLVAVDAELGVFLDRDAGNTTFRTWSPVSESVEALLFRGADDKEPYQTLPLQAAGRGLWEAVAPESLDGVYYQYRFTTGERVRVAADIHGFAASADSGKTMVVDLRATDPPGFREYDPPAIDRPTDEVIYEIHVRDFSVFDPNAPKANRGKYLGLITPGQAKGKTPSTGLQHLKDLGVSAVHLLPIQDFGSERHEYNWGYWTSLFNVPEAQYGTDPDDPAQTIRELKQTIQTLHENDVRVILDVVYNHTSSSGPSSPFENTVPGYYFRTNFDGSLRNDAGVGNSIADERPMVREYIADSLEFWVREYKVDGFRFDLVGTHHPETVKYFTDRLRKIRPDITLYGEPWTGGGPTYFPKGAQRGTGFAVFNDHLRNAVRGDLDGDSTGFGTGEGGDLHAVKVGAAGGIDDFADHPHESVNYVSAHDNRTFWDKLEYTHGAGDDETFRKMQKLAHGVVLTSQGIAFIHGGADFARTKGGNHNSYNAGDEVNKFDWDRKAEYHDVHEYVAGLVALRRAQPAFRMATSSEVRRGVSFLTAPDGVIAFALDGRVVGDGWRKIVVAYNGEPGSQRITLPPGAWNVVVDDQNAGDQPIGQAERRVTLPGYSMWVGYQD
ncbi:MAG: type I pullulanase [Planctomycetota bacterium]